MGDCYDAYPAPSRRWYRSSWSIRCHRLRFRSSNIYAPSVGCVGEVNPRRGKVWITTQVEYCIRAVCFRAVIAGNDCRCPRRDDELVHEIGKVVHRAKCCCVKTRMPPNPWLDWDDKLFPFHIVRGAFNTSNASAFSSGESSRYVSEAMTRCPGPLQAIADLGRNKEQTAKKRLSRIDFIAEG